MRWFLDTEFNEFGYARIDLISIALVPEAPKGVGFYAVAADGWDEAQSSDWVKENVLPLIVGIPRLPRATIRDAILRTIGYETPEFWGYYADYDWVLFCQLFGRMIDLPQGWPKFCRDVKQWQAQSFPDIKLPKQRGQEHNALADAMHIRDLHGFLTGLDNLRRPR